MQNCPLGPLPPREGTAPAATLRRALGVALVCSAAGLSTSCGPEEPAGRAAADLLHLRGELVAEQSLMIVPDKDWRGATDGGWEMIGSANLLCWIGRPQTADLLVRVVPGAEAEGCEFVATWDDEPLLAFQDPRPLDPEGELLRVPTDELTPGKHELRLSRSTTRDSRRDTKRSDLSFKALPFEALTWGIAGDADATAASMQNELVPGDQPAHAYLASFLSLGLTGATCQRAEGILFVGPREHSTVCETGVPARVQFAVENNSQENARFTVHLAGQPTTVDVAPMGRQPIDIPVEPGRHAMKLTVDGPDEGLFLWGAPYLHVPDRELPGPIVLLSLDTTRRDALSIYGGPQDTPNLQALADVATVYDNAWTTGPWTLPTHASMFTGLYPARHGAGVRSDHLRLDHETLTEILQESGYYTAAFVGGIVASTKCGFGQGFHLFRDPEGRETRGDELTNAAQSFLAEHHDKPLFLFMNYFDPHALYRPPPEWAQQYGLPALRRKLSGVEHWGVMASPAQAAFQAWGKIRTGHAELTQDGVDYVRAAYRAEVAFMDEQLGRLFETLKQYELFDRALIIVCSDHGELLGENGMFSHSARLDPELVWMPLIVKWPGQTEGRRVAELASQVDFFPTILEHVLDADHPSEGLSLHPDAEPRLAERVSVFMQEHDRWFHRHIDHMKVAPDLYGVQRRSSREVVWQSDLQFATLEGDRWELRESTLDGATRWEQVLLWANHDVLEHATDTERGMSEEVEDALRQLGYVE